MKGKPVIDPVYMTATYKFDQSDDLIDVVQNRSGYIYSRWDNPSVVAVEKELARLEGYDHAEIAEILGITESTSKSQFLRAKKKMKEILLSHE